jgi:G3E family GTPase
MSEVNVDAQLMKNGSASLSRVDERLVEVSKLAREGRFDYLFVESTGISEPLPVAEPRLGRRTVLTFPLLPPPQKN